MVRDCLSPRSARQKQRLQDLRAVGMKKLTIFAGLVLAACAACAEAMEPIVPVVWRRGAVEETANDLKAIARQSGLL